MPATFGDVYDRLCAQWPDPQERGRRFEPLVAQVLETTPLYARRFAKVWRWAEWPARRSGDIGVDLVAQRFDGGLTAIQVKCYDPGATLHESQLATFLANTNADFDERLVVSTTPRWSGNLLALIERQQPPVQRLDLFGPDATTIDWDHYLEDEAAPLAERPRKTPRPHQTAALAAVRAGLEDGDRGKLVMACGTGKTYTALRAAEDLAGAGGRRSLVLVRGLGRPLRKRRLDVGPHDPAARTRPAERRKVEPRPLRHPARQRTGEYPFGGALRTAPPGGGGGRGGGRRRRPRHGLRLRLRGRRPETVERGGVLPVPEQHRDRLVHGDAFRPLGHEQPSDEAPVGGLQLHRRLVRFDLGDDVARRHAVAFLHEPAGKRPFRHRRRQGRHGDGRRHPASQDPRSTDLAASATSSACGRASRSRLAA